MLYSKHISGAGLTAPAMCVDRAATGGGKLTARGAGLFVESIGVGEDEADALFYCCFSRAAVAS